MEAAPRRTLMPLEADLKGMEAAEADMPLEAI